MLTKNEELIIQQLALFADKQNINKSELSRKIGTTPKTVRNVLNKLKELKTNEK